MKTAVSSYSFLKAVRRGEMTEFDCIAKAAQMGFEGIEFSGLSPREGESRTEYARALRAEAERVGIPIVNYCTASDFLRTDDVRGTIEHLKSEADIAALLGAGLMRHDAAFGFREGERGWRGFDNVVGFLADCFREVTRYAAEKGVRTMVENHGQFVQESARVEKLINTVGDDNFGQLVDIGNFMCADESPEHAVGVCAPYAFHVHVKDFHFKSGSEPDPGEGWFSTRSGNRLRGAILGHGVVPVRQCLAVLAANGYDGWCSIEFEGLEDPIFALRVGLDNLRRYIESV